MQVRYLDPLERFIGGLEQATIAKVMRSIDLLERFGHGLGMPHTRRIDRGLLELRIHGAQEVRIFYAIRQDAAVLLHGFVKKSQRIPARELATALQKLRVLDGV